MATDLSILLRLDGMEAVTSGFDKVSQSMQNFGDKMVSVGKTMSLAVTAPLTAFAVIGIKELSSVQAAMAQTEAAIKSTGGAAGISAKGVRELANTLQQKSAVDAEVIQSGANLLLSFTNIKNVAGENNDIFNRANKTALDLSRAFNQDLKLSAIQLGKALNDPIQGVSALSRVGVQFTDVQKNQIKALVESGKMLDAQKIILAELETQVGGSAEAYSKTMGGALELMKVNVEDLAGSLVQALEPAITGIIAFAMKWLNWFNSLDESTKSVIATIGVLVAAVGPLLIIFGKAVTAIKLLGTTLTFVMNMNPYILAIGALITAGILLYQNWDKVAYYAKVVWNNVKLTVVSAVEIMLDALEHFTGWIPGWGTQISAAAGYVRDMRASIEVDMRQMQKPIQDVGDEVGKTKKQFEELQTGAVPPTIDLTEKVKKLSDAVKTNLVPEFYNLRKVQQELAQKQMPALTAKFTTLEDKGIDPAEKALGKISITTSLLSRNYFPELTNKTTTTTDTFQSLTDKIAVSNKMAIALGNSYDNTAAKTDLIRDAITDMIEKGTDPADESVKKLIAQLRRLEYEGQFHVRTYAEFAMETFPKIGESVETNVTNVLTDLFMGKTVEWKDVWKAFLAETLKEIVAWAVEVMAIKELVASGLGSLFGGTTTDTSGGGVDAASSSTKSWIASLLGGGTAAGSAPVASAAGGGVITESGAVVGGGETAAGSVGGASAGVIGGAIVISGVGAVSHAELTRKDDTLYGSLMSGGTPWQDQKLDEWGGFLNVATAPFQGETATWGAMMNTGEGKKVLEIINNPTASIKKLGDKLGLPGFSHGGIISRPTILMAGESGAEAIVPLNNPRRAAAIMQDAGLSGGVSITQVFKGPVVLDEISMSKWARKQAKLLNREMLRYA